MDIKMYSDTLMLISSMLNMRKSTKNRIPYTPQKKAFDQDEPYLQSFERVSPESRGVQSKYIADYFRALKSDDSVVPQSVMILRNGKMIAEGAYYPYRTDIWHVSHSLCKSVTGLAIGLLIDEKKLELDESLVSIFQKSRSAFSSAAVKSITIRHLLTMTTGITFNEAAAITETDWVGGFLVSRPKFEPGESFEYNSMNSYMLSAVVKEITGKSMSEYLDEKLFGHMGITKYYWEKCPKGIEKGGWGLYIMPEDVAKLGQLCLNGGLWHEKRLISEEWIREATKVQQQAYEYMGRFDYGYQIWRARNDYAFIFNGLFGQNAVMIPKHNMIIVCMAGNDEMFQKSRFFDITEKFFGPSFRPLKRRPENRREYEKLLALQAELGVKENEYTKKHIFFKRALPQDDRLPKAAYKLDGKYYDIAEEDRVKTSILPLFVQAMQNNFSRGIKRIGFIVKDGEFFAAITDGDYEYKIPVGFGRARRAQISFNGEKYSVAVLGKFTYDEDSVPVLKISVYYLELSNVRGFKIFFTKSGIFKAECFETPGIQFIYNGVINVLDANRNKLIDIIADKADTDYLEYKINAALEPVLNAKLAETANIFNDL